MHLPLFIPETDGERVPLLLRVSLRFSWLQLRNTVLRNISISFRFVVLTSIHADLECYWWLLPSSIWHFSCHYTQIQLLVCQFTKILYSFIKARTACSAFEATMRCRQPHKQLYNFWLYDCCTYLVSLLAVCYPYCPFIKYLINKLIIGVPNAKCVCILDNCHLKSSTIYLA